MGYVGGIALIIGLTILAGIIAYLGDRVGHQVGRRRLTLFGLRPKYTSTIVAVATGMFIAFAVMAIALAASKYARAAFFHLDEINDRVNQLQAEADALDKRVHETNVVVNRGGLMFPSFLLIRPAETPAQRIEDLSAFFDAVVGGVNRAYVPRGLRPFKGKASDPENQRKLASLLESTQGLLLQGPVLIVAVADENLFLNDPIHFSFAQFADKQIFSTGQRIASVEVQGGTQINPTAALSLLVGAVSDAAVSQGMPVWYAEPTPILSESQVARIMHEIREGRGRYQIVATAAQNIFPHVGGLPVRVSLTQPKHG